MQYNVNKLAAGKVELKVTIPKADFDSSYKTVLEQLAKDAKIDGFRPGNVPEGVAESKIGSNKILNEVANFIVSKHLGVIFKKENLAPIDQPKMTYDTLAKGSPFVFTVSFTQKPKVKIGDWKKIKVKAVKAREVTDKDVDESVKNIFEAWKKRKAKVPEAEKKDEAKDEDEKKGKFIYNAQGEKVYIENKKDKKSETDKKDHKLDDEFAKAVGTKDLAHLKEIVKKDLEALAAEHVEAKLQEEIFTEIRKLAEIDIPDILIEDELNRMLVRLNSQLEQQKKELKDYLEEQKLTVEQLRFKWREQAEKNVRATLALDEIGHNEGIKVTEEEIKSQLSKVSEKELDEKQKKNLENYIAYNIFQAKTIALIKKVITL